MNSLYDATHRNTLGFSEEKARSVLMHGDDNDIRRKFLNQSALYLGMDLTDGYVAFIIAGKSGQVSTAGQNNVHRIM